MATPTRTSPANVSWIRLRVGVLPMNGSRKLRETIWPMASTIVVSSTRKPQKMEACMTPEGKRCRSFR